MSQRTLRVICRLAGAAFKGPRPPLRALTKVQSQVTQVR